MPETVKAKLEAIRTRLANVDALAAGSVSSMEESRVRRELEIHAPDDLRLLLLLLYVSALEKAQAHPVRVLAQVPPKEGGLSRWELTPVGRAALEGDQHPDTEELAELGPVGA